MKTDQKRASILKDLAEIDKLVSDKQRYQHLRDVSPEAKMLLDQLDQLSAA